MTNASTVCLVTGCAGFVGSHLTAALLGRGMTVVGVDNFFSGRRENMASFADHPAFRFLERDFESPNLLDEALRGREGPLHVFHLAAVVSVPWSVEHPEETLRVNAEATLELFAEARKMGATSFTFAGSAAEYGDARKLPIREEDVTAETVHASPYGLAKYTASSGIAASGFGSSLRFFNIYGPRQDPSSPYSGVISRFIDLGLSGKPLTVFGDGLQTRDMVFVGDAVRSYLCAAGLEGSWGAPLSGIYNVASGRAATVLDLARLVKDSTGNDREILFFPPRPGDIRHSLGDPGRLFRETGFRAETALDRGLAATAQWRRLELEALQAETEAAA